MSGKPVYLFVTPFFPSPTSWRGGYCYDMVKTLERVAGGRYDVRVFVPGDGSQYEYDGIEVVTFRHCMLSCGLAPFFIDGRNKRKFEETLLKVGIAWDKVDVCHVHTTELVYVAVLAKEHNSSILTLLHHHCINPIRLDSGRLGIVPIHATILYLYLRRMCESVDAHVFCSEQSRLSYAKRYCNGVPENGFEDIKNGLFLGRFLRSFYLGRSLVLYNGYDTSLFHHEQERNDHEIWGSFVIGCVANFQPLKDHITLIKAVEKVCGLTDVSIRLRLIGSGQTLSLCKRYVVNHGLGEVVEFMSELDHREMPSFYHSLDLFVLPSRTEGFCCAYSEAIGCGIPVMGCKGVSLEEVISYKDHDKWLCKPCDADDLATKILAYMEKRWRFVAARNLDMDSLWRDFVLAVRQLRSS